MTRTLAVLEGGGVKGIALAGAAAAAMDAGHVFDAAVGTSAGALVGSLLVAGYSSDELRDTVCSLDWPGLLDPAPIGEIPLIGKHLSVLLWKGMYKGDALEATWSDLLAAKGISTFGDLPDRSLRIVVTDLTHSRGVVFPGGLSEYGIDPKGFSVARAVRISATVPFVFRPIRLRHRGTGDLADLVDGGLASKYPIQLADFERKVLGFRLAEPLGPHTHHKIRGPLSLAAAVVTSGIAAREHLPVLCANVGDTITMTVDRDPLDFNLSAADARAMFDLGYRTAQEALTSH